MLWALWSLKQGQHSNIPFAYFSFARDRLKDYLEHKARVVHLDIYDNGDACDTMSASIDPFATLISFDNVVELVFDTRKCKYEFCNKLI